jgi:transcriptional regulator with XRE-family HTH domain
MRARRSRLGLTGSDLAERAGISTSYVSLIENGAKIPDEQVAADIARALGDDEDLYRAWARAARLGPRELGLLTRLEVASRTPAFVSLVESGQALPRLADSDGGGDDLALRMREVARRLSSPSPSAEDLTGSPSVVSIPVLAEGADPARIDETGAAVADRLLLDRRLLGRGATDLFACVVVAGDMRHLRGLAEPGDRVVFERGATLAPDRICAVRAGGRLVLSRVLRSGGALLLLPGEGETGFELLEIPDDDALVDRVAGAHVLLIRH